MQPNADDGEPTDAVHVDQPPRASGRGDTMENGFGGADGRYLAQGETLDVSLNISESNILVFNLGKECQSHQGVVKKLCSSVSVALSAVSLPPEGVK